MEDVGEVQACEDLGSIFDYVEAEGKGMLSMAWGAYGGRCSTRRRKIIMILNVVGGTPLL